MSSSGLLFEILLIFNCERAVQQGLMKYVCLFGCVFVSTFEIHLLRVHQANQSTV